ncbi:MAG: hypothetical protein A2Y28_03155 [Chlamydiae bacterium GWC2_50_10]|nr:MAG: hypothetical protein A2Z85_01595 [Chlamydiae bacterium GWA2_50_15]OGN54259.1 MAG: hypothetical protein A2Y28_03155 [Chlamydiae bacterium GWC2_50_10]OGN54386.1 MAG: hypothetical protein A2098_02060 [Chlamydiae bacterium GWF2_49_8]OGN58781.1 MAG: hypothetical protein A3D18_06145 [Chlamydiae bacterium RIFCSPHIGHO2_02_FULL_49_29]OGN63247.1 MAG: hypothetical protein A3E26_04935 [Chlamydiae bacterium RIFCSPHIGHO2_12_FULL_49_32]OGN68389.1 MAG: hypothetical protein A3I15_04385 [Chlamydiae bact
MDIQIDDKFRQALHFLEETDENLFITGHAGTGKSTLLSYVLLRSSKQIVVLAPTGVAALNIRGQTIHSFFRFRPQVTLEQARRQASQLKDKEIYLHIDLIIIDEISMVRADLLDCIDLFLQTVLKKSEPFGGIRIAFFGDLYQLAPVISSQEREYFKTRYESSYFFSAKVMKEGRFSFQFLELEKIYRQQDLLFIDLLNAIRKKSLSEQDLKRLNERSVPLQGDDAGYLYLTATNRAAEEINAQKLEEIPSKLFSFTAQIEGDFDLKNAPTEFNLQLKVGAQVMFLVNDLSGLWVNGTIGRVVSASDSEISVDIEGSIVSVGRHTWDLYKYIFDEKKNRLEQEKEGFFEQFPLKLAWAITIHKSQGKTYDRVIIDFGRALFAPGQAYVALSRCRTLEGIILKRPFEERHVILDFQVVKFLTTLQYKIAEMKCSLENKQTLIRQAIDRGEKLEIIYLKTNDEKTERTIVPTYMGEMEYGKKRYVGVEAFCTKRNEKRVFKVERILEILPRR